MTPRGASLADPQDSNTCRWSGDVLLGNALYAVRDAIRTSEAGLANPASCHCFCAPTSPDGIHEISPEPPSPTALARACPSPPSTVSICFSDTPADNNPEFLAYRAWRRPLSRAVRTRSASRRRHHYARRRLFTAKNAVRSGANALARFGLRVAP